MSSDSESDNNIVNFAFETKPTDEASSPEFIAAILTDLKAKPVFLFKTPDWLCEKYKIDPEDMLTRRIGYVPATADRGELYIFSTIGRAEAGSETCKRLQSIGIPEITKEQFEKEDRVSQRFLSGGFNPGIRSRLQEEKRRIREIRKMERKMMERSKERRQMTRKTVEREKMKRKFMEKESLEKIKCPCFVFECTYCGHQLKRLASLKNHVFGTKAKIFGKPFLRIQCGKRLFQDGLLEKYERNEIPLTCPPPKKQLWAKVTCKDTKLIDSQGKFDIPHDIATEWARFFKKIQT